MLLRAVMAAMLIAAAVAATSAVEMAVVVIAQAAEGLTVVVSEAGLAPAVAAVIAEDNLFYLERIDF